MQVWGMWGAVWSFADPVQFDGVAKTITVNPEISNITTVEIYSSWVRWVGLYDHLKYPQAIRTVGGDTLPGGQVQGIFLFLMNGWKIVIGHAVTIDGILYSDDGTQPYTVLGGGGIVNKVAALAYAYDTNGSTSPTVNEISEAVWNKAISTMQDKNTIGGFISKMLLTVPKFLGLK